MTATLYIPGQNPLMIAPEGMHLPNSETGFVPQSDTSAHFLGCKPNQVDILTSGPDFVVYSIFDNDGDINYEAMIEIVELSGVHFELDNEDELLRGRVLILRD